MSRHLHHRQVRVVARLTEIVHPATLAQLDYYCQLGLRERVLTLPVTPSTWRCGQVWWRWSWA
jgi:hypothetical protein